MLPGGIFIWPMKKKKPNNPGNPGNPGDPPVEPVQKMIQRPPEIQQAIEEMDEQEFEEIVAQKEILKKMKGKP